MDMSKPEMRPVLQARSDRVEQLQQELTPEQFEQLAAMLKKSTFEEWQDWLRKHEGEIAEFDSLPAARRARKLADADAPRRASSSRERPAHGQHPFLLLHACAYLAHLQHHLDNLMPPRGRPLQMPGDQRMLLLDLVNRLPALEDDALWPFEWPQGHRGPQQYWPFRD